MPKGTTKKGKKVVSSGAASKSSGSGSLFKKTERNFRIGGNIQPVRNLTRYVKWPKYVRIQRQKKDRLQSEAEARKGGNKADKIGPKPIHLNFGLNHVTTLVEEGKAKLVAIASDVEPVEMMSFLPSLCKSKNVAFCIVKGKHNLGKLLGLKTATCVAVTDVRKEDMQDFNTLQKTFMANFNENLALNKSYGGGLMGIKNQHMMAKREKIREIELAKKANM